MRNQEDVPGDVTVMLLSSVRWVPERHGLGEKCWWQGRIQGTTAGGEPSPSPPSSRPGPPAPIGALPRPFGAPPGHPVPLSMHAARSSRWAARVPCPNSSATLPSPLRWYVQVTAEVAVGTT